MKAAFVVVGALVGGCNDGRLVATGTSDGGQTDAGVGPSHGGSPDGGSAAGSDAGSDAGTRAVTLTTSPGLGQVHLSWIASAAATGYDIYRSDTPGTLGGLVASTAAAQLDDTSVATFAPYYYTVVATIAGSPTPSNQAEGFAYDFAHMSVRRANLTLRAIAVAPASSRYVAVGDAGRTLISDDGVAWTSTWGPAALALSGVTYGGGRFVAVGTSAFADTHSIFTSTDGTGWTTRDATTTSPLFAVAAATTGPSAALITTYIAVGDAGTIVTSTDGAAWTGHSCGTDKLVSIAVTEYSDGTTTQFMAFAVGGTTACWSTDGATWTALPATTHHYTGAAAFDDTHEVLAVASDQSVLHASYDFAAHTFTLLPGTSGAGYPYSFVQITAYDDAGGTRHVVGLDSQDDLGESTDHGQTWTMQSYGSRTIIETRQGHSYNLTTGVASSPSALFVLGAGEQLQRSTDNGQSFTVLRTDEGGSNVGVAWNHGVTVVGHAPELAEYVATLYSSDGATFNDADPGVLAANEYDAEAPVNVLGTATGFAMFYPRTTGGLKVTESTDGVSWTASVVSDYATVWGNLDGTGTAAVIDGNYLASFGQIYNGGPWYPIAVWGSSASALTAPIASGFGTTALVALWGKTGDIYGLADTQVFRSAPDNYNPMGGSSWSAYSSLPFAGATTQLTDGATHYVASKTGMLTSSADNASWSAPVAIDARGVRRLVRLGDHLIAIGDRGLFAVSADGVTWTALVAPVSSDFRDIAITDHGFVFVGSNDVVVTAP